MALPFTRTFVAVTAAAAFLSGCGGGGGADGTAMPAAGVAAQTTVVKLAFTLGSSISTSSHARHLDYISRSTNGIGIRAKTSGVASFSGSRVTPGAGNVAADVTLGSSNCITGVSPARTCTLLVVVPVGYNDFEITTWDAPPSGGTFSGNQLSNALVSNQLTQSNQNNPIPFTLNGVVASVALSLSTTTLTSGTAATPTLTVLAKDSSGNIIIAPGTYVDSSGSPVTITVSATPACTLGTPVCTTPGSTVLGTTSFTSPAITTSTIAYDGGPLTSSAFAVTAPSLTGNTGATLSFTNTNTGGIGIPGTPTITELTPPTASQYNTFIAQGPDGNMWFPEQGANKIAKLTPAGAFTEYTVPTLGSQPLGIASGPDGAVWFDETIANKIGRVSTSGVFTEYTAGLSASANLYGMTLGPDGNIWFAEEAANKIGKITPSGAITEYSIPTANAQAFVIATGPDGNLWFTERAANKIAKVTPSGAFTEYGGLTGTAPWGITSGSDGNMWFTEAGRIGKITTSGTITEFASAVAPTLITSAPDGNLWFTVQSTAQIGRITTAGSISVFGNGITTGSFPQGIATGSDNDIYFVENFNGGNGKIGKVVP